jgi:transposase InsO family protein
MRGEAHWAHWAGHRPRDGRIGRGPWRSLEDVEFATHEWVWWFNHHRLLEPLGYIPPVEYEEAFYRRQETQDLVPVLTN